MAKNQVIPSAGLESAENNQASLIVEETTSANFSNREWLENNSPEFLPEFVSTKYDAEREPKVQEGLKVIAEMMGDKVNPLVLLLGKWWEIKPARNEIKKMLDAEAAAKLTPSDTYLQIVCRENIDKIASISQATDRLKYSITYFKPRAGVSSKDTFNLMSINGETYNVSVRVLSEAKLKFVGEENRDALKAYVIENSTKLSVAEEL